MCYDGSWPRPRLQTAHEPLVAVARAKCHLAHSDTDIHWHSADTATDIFNADGFRLMIHNHPGRIYKRHALIVNAHWEVSSLLMKGPTKTVLSAIFIPLTFAIASLAASSFLVAQRNMQVSRSSSQNWTKHNYSQLSRLTARLGLIMNPHWSPVEVLRPTQPHNTLAVGILTATAWYHWAWNGHYQSAIPLDNCCMHPLVLQHLQSWYCGPVCHSANAIPSGSWGNKMPIIWDKEGHDQHPPQFDNNDSHQEQSTLSTQQATKITKIDHSFGLKPQQWQ